MEAVPAPRGDISEFVIAALRRTPHTLARIIITEPEDPLGDDDLQLSLYLCYELHYRGLPGVDDRWEWQPSLLAVRARLEQIFERALKDAVPWPDDSSSDDSGDEVLAGIAGRGAV